MDRTSRGKSRRRRQREQEPDIPVTSFGDVAFLLLIFFIVVTSLMKTTGFQTELPAAEKAKEENKDKKDILLRDGMILYNEKAVSLEDLRAKLAGMNLSSLPNKDKTIRLEVQGQDAWQVYYEVMAVIKESGGIIGIIMPDDSEQQEGKT